MIDVNFKIDTKIKSMQIKIKSLENPEKIVTDLMFYGENQITLNARDIVYSYKPKSKSKRTGNTYRAIKSFVKNKYSSVLSPDSRNAGLSDIDYSIFIDRGRNKRGFIPARPFVSKTFDDMKKKVKDLIKKYVSK